MDRRSATQLIAVLILILIVGTSVGLIVMLRRIHGQQYNLNWFARSSWSSLECLKQHLARPLVDGDVHLLEIVNTCFETHNTKIDVINVEGVQWKRIGDVYICSPNSGGSGNETNTNDVWVVVIGKSNLREWACVLSADGKETMLQSVGDTEEQILRNVNGAYQQQIIEK